MHHSKYVLAFRMNVCISVGVHLCMYGRAHVFNDMERCIHIRLYPSCDVHNWSMRVSFNGGPMYNNTRTYPRFVLKSIKMKPYEWLQYNIQNVVQVCVLAFVVRFIHTFITDNHVIGTDSSHIESDQC